MSGPVCRISGGARSLRTSSEPLLHSPRLTVSNFVLSFLYLYRQSRTATGTSYWPLWRSITKWREVRSPPAWQTLETLSPWCSWTAQPRRTSSTASKAAASARARPAATPWIAPPRWNVVACGGDPHSSKSKSPIWRMWTPSTAGHESSSLLFSPSSTSSTGSITSDGTITVTCLLLFDYMFSIFVPFWSRFLLLLYIIEPAVLKTVTSQGEKKKSWQKKWLFWTKHLSEMFLYLQSLYP